MGTEHESLKDRQEDPHNVPLYADGENNALAFGRRVEKNIAFKVVPVIPSSQLSPPHSPLPIVRLFLTSMSLVIFCLLFSSIYYVPVKGEIIWYLSLTAWLISLNIILSSSIHAATKGRSSFFFYAA